MADAATADPPPAIADLAGGDDKSMAGLVSSLAQIDRRKLKKDTEITAESDAQQAKDKVQRDQAFALEGVAASELPKPWDADKEHKKWESNPIEGFGSMGGLFAMVASAFTKAPMENAINGMAGAINAIKDGNEANYQRAFDAFKTNVKLADQRFKMQHEVYTDALQLSSVDMAASDAKLRNAAVRFGDQHALTLIEHGMSKEIYELITARANANEQMVKSAEAIDLHTVQKAAVDAIKKNPPMTGDPVQDKMQLAAQVQRVYDGGGKYGTAEQEAVGRYVQAHLKDPPDKFVDGLIDIHQQFSVKAPNIQGYQDARQAAMDANGGTISADEDAALLAKFGLTATRAGGAGGRSTENNVVAEEIKRRTAEYVASGMSQAEAFDKATREVKTAERKPDQPKSVTENNVIAAEIQKRAADYIAGGMDPHAAFDKALQEIKAASAKPGSTGGLPKNSSQLKIAEMQEIKDAAAKEGRTLSTSEAEDKWAEHQAKIKMETATITGNKADDLLRKRDLATEMIADSNKNIDFLQTHKWPAGVLGKVMRGEELVGNIAGTTDTERKDFYRRVHEMSMIAPQLLADQTGRPLKAMQDEVRSVVAGLEAGDTGPNTISAYRSLIERLEKRQADWNTRLTKSPAENAREGGAPSAPATEKSGKRPLWESAPIDPSAPGKGSSASEPPPVEGARKAPDGNWYVDDPDRPGKFLKVMVS